MRAALLLLVVALVSAGCQAGHGGDDDDQAPVPQRLDAHGHIVLTGTERTAIGLETALAKQGVLTSSSLRFGKVVGRPQDSALVVAPVSGRLSVPRVDLGAHVSKGDKLVALEPLVSAASQASIQAQRRELQGQVEGARAEVEARKSELARVSGLVTSGLATHSSRAQAKAALTAEKAREKSLERAVADLGQLSGGRIQLRAPAGGVIASLVTDTGALVDQGTVIARIVEAGPRWIDLAVPPGDAVGDSYRVKGVSQSVSAKLLSRGVVIEADGTRRDRLEAPPDAAVDLPPGATVAVEVDHKTQGVVVPVAAVLRHGADSVVFVKDSDGTFAMRKVQLGVQSSAQAVISSGLRAGKHVVSRGGWALLGVIDQAPPHAGAKE